MTTNQEKTCDVMPGMSPSPSLVLPPIKIKQEPVDAASTEPSANPIHSPLQSPPANWEHHRVRPYTRIKHVASPDTSVCEVCQGEFIHPAMLLLHKICHFNTNHVCYVCDSYFVHTDTLILHMATIHRSLAVSSQNYKGETERAFVCSRCLQRFSSNKMLTKHQKMHTLRDDTSYACKICALDFIGNRALTAHLSSPRHKEMKAKLQGIFICVDCRAIFPTRDSYAMHMMMRAQSETCDKITDDDDASPMMATDSAAGQQPSEGTLQNAAVTMATISDLMQTSNKTGSSASGQSYGLTQSHSLMPPVYLTPQFDQTGEAIVRNIISGLQQQQGSKQNSVTSRESDHSSSLSDQPEKETCGSPLNLSTSRREELGTHCCQENQLKMNHTKFLCKDCNILLDTQDAYAMHVMLHARGTPVSGSPVAASTPVKSTGGMTVRTRAGFRYQAPILSPQTRPYSAPVNEALKAGGQRISLTPATCAPSVGWDTPQTIGVGDDTIAEKPQSGPNGDEPSRHQQDNVDNSPKQRKKRSASADDATNAKRIKCGPVMSCTECQGKFSDISELTTHKRTCLATVCTLCNLAFVDNFGLRVHQRCKSHLEQVQLKNLICHLCGWFASRPQEYVEHMKQHLPELQDSGASQLLPNGHDTAADSKTDPATQKVTQSDEMTTPSDTTTEVAATVRRSKRKPRAAAKCIPTSQSSDFDEVWSESSGGCETPMTGFLSDRPLPLMGNNPSHHQHMGNSHTANFLGCSKLAPRGSVSDTECSTPVTTSTRPTTTSGHLLDDSDDIDVVDYVLSNAQRLVMCKYCKVIYLDKTMYYLHMGLHNLNNPWQCNLCGKVCRDVHEFSSHVIHY